MERCRGSRLPCLQHAFHRGYHFRFGEVAHAPGAQRALQVVDHRRRAKQRSKVLRVQRDGPVPQQLKTLARNRIPLQELKQLSVRAYGQRVGQVDGEQHACRVLLVVQHTVEGDTRMRHLQHPIHAFAGRETKYPPELLFGSRCIPLRNGYQHQGVAIQPHRKIRWALQQ